MGFLNAGQKTQITKYSGVQVQSTSSTNPCPIVYGVAALAPTIVWYQNFRSHPQKSGKGGGKGGGGSSATSYTYTADIIMALCEGPIDHVGNVWQASTVPTTLTHIGLSLFDGTTPQAAWSYLASRYPTEALTYPGTCFVAQANYNLGASATVNENNIEVYGVLQGSGFNGLDADPAQVIYDFLTNAQYGVGFPAASLSSDSLFNPGYGYQRYCQAVGFAFSPVLNMQEQATSILARWLQITNSTAIWSDGMLKVIPFGDSPVTGNGATWAPNTPVVYSLTDDDYLHAEGEDPIQIGVVSPYALANWQAVEITGRSDNYGTGPVYAFDQAAINRFGLKVGSTITAHEFMTPAIGQIAAQLILQRTLYIRNSYKFKLGEEFCLLEPMDLIAVTDSNLGLIAEVVRIAEIEEQADGTFAVTAEEFPQGVATAVAYPVQTKSTGAPMVAPDAVPVNPPAIFEPPPQLTSNTVQLWIGVSPQNGDANWGGCIVWASLDGGSYAQVDTIRSAARQGVLTADLPPYSGANPDVGDTLSIDLTMSAGSLEFVDARSRRLGRLHVLGRRRICLLHRRGAHRRQPLQPDRVVPGAGRRVERRQRRRRAILLPRFLDPEIHDPDQRDREGHLAEIPVVQPVRFGFGGPVQLPRLHLHRDIDRRDRSGHLRAGAGRVDGLGRDRQRPRRRVRRLGNAERHGHRRARTRRQPRGRADGNRRERRLWRDNHHSRRRDARFQRRLAIRAPGRAGLRVKRNTNGRSGEAPPRHGGECRRLYRRPGRVDRRYLEQPRHRPRRRDALAATPARVFDEIGSRRLGRRKRDAHRLQRRGLHNPGQRIASSPSPR